MEKQSYRAEEPHPSKNGSKTCVKCGYVRTATDKIWSDAACPKCGLLYAKSEAYTARGEQPRPSEDSKPAKSSNSITGYKLPLTFLFLIITILIVVSTIIRAYLVAKVHGYLGVAPGGGHLLFFLEVLLLLLQGLLMGAFINDAFEAEQLHPSVTHVIKYTAVCLGIGVIVILLYWFFFMGFIRKSEMASLESRHLWGQIRELARFLEGPQALNSSFKWWLEALLTPVFITMGVLKFHSWKSYLDEMVFALYLLAFTATAFMIGERACFD